MSWIEKEKNESEEQESKRVKSRNSGRFTIATIINNENENGMGKECIPCRATIDRQYN
jgi:hypothetical protein